MLYKNDRNKGIRGLYFVMRRLIFVLTAIMAMACMPGDVCGHKVDPKGNIEVKKEEKGSDMRPATAVYTDKSEKKSEVVSEDVLFERAVEIIKKFESLHKASHWPYVGYGHRVRKGDGFKRGVALSERQADRLLRRDLQVYVDMYSGYGKDAVLLAALAYNCGNGRVNASPVVSKLKRGDRDIRDAYLAHAKSGGKFRRQLHERRVAEFEALFIP